MLHFPERLLKICKHPLFIAYTPSLRFGCFLQLLQAPWDITHFYLLAQFVRSLKVPMGKRSDLTDAQMHTGYSSHKCIHLFFCHCVYTYKRTQDIQVGIGREAAIKNSGFHALAHVDHDATTHTHPGLAFFK